MSKKSSLCTRRTWLTCRGRLKEEKRLKAEARAKKAEERARKEEEKAKRAEEKAKERALKTEERSKRKTTNKKRAEPATSSEPSCASSCTEKNEQPRQKNANTVLSRSEDLNSGECCVCFDTYDEDVALETGRDWVECACQRWLHEELLGCFSTKLHKVGVPRQTTIYFILWAFLSACVYMCFCSLAICCHYLWKCCSLCREAGIAVPPRFRLQYQFYTAFVTYEIRQRISFLHYWTHFWELIKQNHFGHLNWNLVCN